MGISKTIDHIQNKIKIPNSSQESPACSKGLSQNLKNMDVLCTFKIKIETQNLEYGCIKDQWLNPNQDQDAHPSQEPSNSSKAPSQDLEDIDVFAPRKSR